MEAPNPLSPRYIGETARQTVRRLVEQQTPLVTKDTSRRLICGDPRIADLLPPNVYGAVLRRPAHVCEVHQQYADITREAANDSAWKVKRMHSRAKGLARFIENTLLFLAEDHAHAGVRGPGTRVFASAKQVDLYLMATFLCRHAS